MKRWSIAAVVCVVAAYAFLMQGGGASQNSHYAQIKALAAGTAIIDETRHEVGDIGTPDVSYVDGHYYSNKAPGLAFLTLPLYMGLAAAGVETTGDPRRMLWALGLLGTVLPFAIGLLVVRWLGDWFAAPYGTAAAVSYGLGTIALPFGTMFFSHALSSTLGIGAFALLVRERQGPGNLLLVFAAGLCAGLAVTSEYPLALVAAILALYTLLGRPRVRRVAAYAAGGLLGGLPLLVYNTWAFGSPIHLSYERTVVSAGQSGHDLIVEHPAFGISAPDVYEGAAMLFSRWGLLGTGPVVAVGVAGAIIAFRRGLRAEATVIMAVAAATVAYVSGYFGTWGSISPGPRYMTLLLPFVAATMAVGFLRAPLVALALAAVSIVSLACITATLPMKAWFGGVLDRLTSGPADGYSPSVTELVGVSGWYDVLPFFVLVAAAAACAARATPWVARRADAVAAAAALAAWYGVVWQAAPRILDSSLDRTARGALVLGIVAACAAGVVTIARGSVDEWLRAIVVPRPRRHRASPP